ncbi:T9SS type A sorting domain-containing protein [Chitinophaga sp. 22536]|uniref:T9SS type A sorting domain-containing protein n=1 Tax=unclassified Chitinophaga TaxID=2619133 RepID=UPI003F8786A2
MKLFLPLLFLLTFSLSTSAQTISGNASPCPGTPQRYTITAPCTGASVTFGVKYGNATITQYGLSCDIVFSNEIFPKDANRVIANYSCGGSSTQVEFPITIKALPTPYVQPQIFNLPCNFKGVQTFVSPEGAYGTQYTWESNTSWTVNNGAGTRSITYNVNGVPAGAKVKVRISNDCPSMSAVEQDFYIQPVGVSLGKPDLSSEIWPRYICKRSTQDVSINQDIANATEYVWEADQPSIRINGQVPPVTLPAATGKKVTISNVDDVEKTAVISCKASTGGGCSVSAPGTLSFRVNAAPVVEDIWGMPPGGRLSPGDQYAFYVPAHPAMTSYRWTALNGTISGGQGTNQAWVVTTSVGVKESKPFNVTLTYLSQCGESVPFMSSGRIYGPGGGGPETFTISPNPASDVLTIRDKDFKSGTSYEVKIYDMNNQEVRRSVSNGQQQLSVNISGLRNGQYIVQINRNGKITASHILINR